MERLDFNRFQTWLHSRNGTVAELLVGVGLAFAGVMLLLGGLTPKPTQKTAPAETPTIDSDRQVNNSGNRRYRLRWMMESGQWQISSMGTSDEVTIDVIPGPRNSFKQKGFVPIEEIRSALMDQLRDWDMELEPAERSILLKVQLDGQALFTEEMLKGGALVSTTGQAAESTSITSSGSIPPLPEEFNPFSSAFATGMQTWRTKVLTLLNGAKGQDGVIDIPFETEAGVMVRAPMTASVRRMAASERFGEDYRHAALFLQIMARQKGADINVDGQVGPGTRQSLAALLKREGWSGDSNAYTAWIRQYTGRGLPVDLVPGSQAFQAAMNRWKTRIEPLLGSSARDIQVEWTPDYFPTSVSLQMAEDAVKRVLAADFGSQRNDEVIFLQFIANTLGERLDVDGSYGPNTERALGRVMRNAFRRPTSERDYLRILAARY